jgi:ABC-type transporter Mla subunit MlaD
MSVRVAAIAVTLAASIVAAMLIARPGSGSAHSVVAVVPDAPELLAHDPIMAAGQPVGEVASMSPVRRGRAVRLVLNVNNAAWPLTQGSRFALRWGGTASLVNRYVELTRGPVGAPAISDGATIPSSDFASTVELDTLTGVFTRAVRADTATMIDRAGPAFHAAEAPLRRGLVAAPPALDQASNVLQDLQASNGNLDALLRSTDRVANAVQSSDPGMSALLAGAGTTFAAVAGRDRALQTALERMPQMLALTRGTLRHASGTLSSAGSLLQRLGPGVTQVRGIAAPLNDVLTKVRTVAPDVTATLDTVSAATPALNPLLDLVNRLMPQLGSIGGQATTALKCIRPYAPDIAGFMANWGDFLTSGDGKDRFIRATLQNLIPAPLNALPYNSGTAAKLFPGLRYAFPRPPGDNAGQPWLLPECGIGPDALNPAKDPEARSGR